MILQDGYTFLIIAPFMKSLITIIQRMNDLTLKASDLGFSVYCASSARSYLVFKETFQPAFQICTTDETTQRQFTRKSRFAGPREAPCWENGTIPIFRGRRNQDQSLSVYSTETKSQERSSVIILTLGVIFSFGSNPFQADRS
jgi:hypothetical protein